MKWFWAAVILAAGSSEANSQEYVERVESQIYESAGDVSTLSARAATCAAQVLKPGFSTAPTVLATDLTGGVVVANSYFQFMDTFSTPEARSKVRIEARPGRFRIIHTEIEVFNKSWRPVRALKEGKRDPLRERLQAISDDLAACVRAKTAPEDW